VSQAAELSEIFSIPISISHNTAQGQGNIVFFCRRRKVGNSGTLFSWRAIIMRNGKKILAILIFLSL
jgi:hypothetical protein